MLTHHPLGPGGVGPPRRLVDPVELTGDPTAAIDWFEPSPDGSLVAYGRSTGGDERSTLHLVEVASGRHLPDAIPHTRAASVAWWPDGTSFAYTRYPSPEEQSDPGEREYHRHVFRHHLGTDWRADRALWSHLPDRTAWPTIAICPEGRWALVHLSIGWSRVDVHLVDLAATDEVRGWEPAARPVLEGTEALSWFAFDGDRLVGHTTLDADRGRVVAAPLDQPEPAQWTTLVAESSERDVVIDEVARLPSGLAVLTSHLGVSTVQICNRDGAVREVLALPDPCSVHGLDASLRRDELWWVATGFGFPPRVFGWSSVAGSLQPDGAPVGTDSSVPDPGPATDARALPHPGSRTRSPTGSHPDALTVEHTSYEAPDGTPIPVFLLHHPSVTPTATTPCLLTGYGGFAVSMGPAWSAALALWCEAGGLVAVPGLRGGGERGEAWHRAGMREHKSRVFDDFAAAADWLVARGLTSHRHLALRGGSNGGLLVTATITRRPDVAAAVHAAVPLCDMVRYPRFLIGELWIPEYGDPVIAEELDWLLAYSPYHRVVDGSCYPAVLLTCAEGDSRVDPAHARKMAARLQRASTCGDRNPILLVEEADAGHGPGKPRSRQADELADTLGFLAAAVGLDPTVLDTRSA